MNVICPECKNDIDLSNYPSIIVDTVIECNMCGITLQVVKNDGNTIEVEIIDEGK